MNILTFKTQSMTWGDNFVCVKWFTEWQRSHVVPWECLCSVKYCPKQDYVLHFALKLYTNKAVLCIYGWKIFVKLAQQSKSSLRFIFNLTRPSEKQSSSVVVRGVLVWQSLDFNNYILSNPLTVLLRVLPSFKTTCNTPAAFHSQTTIFSLE